MKGWLRGADDTDSCLSDCEKHKGNLLCIRLCQAFPEASAKLQQSFSKDSVPGALSQTSGKRELCNIPTRTWPWRHFQIFPSPAKLANAWAIMASLRSHVWHSACHLRLKLAKIAGRHQCLSFALKQKRERENE